MSAQFILLSLFRKNRSGIEIVFIVQMILYILSTVHSELVFILGDNYTLSYRFSGKPVGFPVQIPGDVSNRETF